MLKAAVKVKTLDELKKKIKMYKPTVCILFYLRLSWAMQKDQEPKSSHPDPECIARGVCTHHLHCKGSPSIFYNEFAETPPEILAKPFSEAEFRKDILENFYEVLPLCHANYCFQAACDYEDGVEVKEELSSTDYNEEMSDAMANLNTRQEEEAGPSQVQSQVQSPVPSPAPSPVPSQAQSPVSSPQVPAKMVRQLSSSSDEEEEVRKPVKKKLKTKHRTFIPQKEQPLPPKVFKHKNQNQSGPGKTMNQMTWARIAGADDGSIEHKKPPKNVVNVYLNTKAPTSLPRLKELDPMGRIVHLDDLPKETREQIENVSKINHNRYFKMKIF